MMTPLEKEVARKTGQFVDGRELIATLEPGGKIALRLHGLRGEPVRLDLATLFKGEPHRVAGKPAVEGRIVFTFEELEARLNIAPVGYPEKTAIIRAARETVEVALIARGGLDPEEVLTNDQARSQ